MAVDGVHDGIGWVEDIDGDSKPPLPTPGCSTSTASHHTFETVVAVDDSSMTTRVEVAGATALTEVRDHTMVAPVVGAATLETTVPAAS